MPTKEADGQWVPFDAMSTDVHAYRADPSYRCLHVRLPAGLSGGSLKLRVQINASTGTELLAYQGYSSEPRELGPTAEPVTIDVDDLGGDVYKRQVHRVSGMILNPRFYEIAPLSAEERAAARAKLGFDPAKPVGLVLFGGEGSAAMREIARRRCV